MSTTSLCLTADAWDDVFHALSAGLRRHVVLALNEASPEEWVQLPEAIAKRADVPGEESVRVQLHHIHLPVLAERDYVEWEADPLRVRRGPAFAEVGSAVECLVEETGGLPEQLVAGRTCAEPVERR
ncbi:DUF7344 domain-containing protein [Halomicrobium urmianum]|uniref:DUF7344 domain-containing protein n=1 Tax=Halomicrobium urmianum TaxID=1586233 RepID=UPI001CDA4952|nr:hypothetical protein [Halomicrobium urmianum]